MRYGSVCSGIEAATTAWHSLGWTPAWFSEIEAFPSAVLNHHYPTVPNHGDMTKFEEWPDEPIDLLVGGTPCQSFSVAGLRKGLADPRGNLMLTYLAIAQRHRPRWLVWENVPGVLSSNGGRDFGTFLGALGELGYGFAYRVLDAQWFGVAQRRRRVFVVGYLGDWQRAAEVLFESESVCRNPAPSREKGQDAAKCLTAGVGKRYDFETETLPVAPTLQANDGAKWGSNQWIDEGKAIVQPIGFGAQMSVPQTDVDLMQTLQAKNPMAVAQPVPYDFYQITAPVNRQSRKPGDPCHTLARDNAAHATIVQPTYGIPGNWIGRQPENGGNAVEPMHDVSPCLTKTDRHGVAQPVMFSIMPMNSGKDYKAREVEVAQPLMAGGPVGGNQGGDYVAQPVATFSTPAIGCIKEDHVSSAITRNTGGGGETQNPAYVMAQPVGFDSYNLTETGDVMQTIKSPQGGVTESVGAVMVAQPVAMGFYQNEGSHGSGDNAERSPTLKAHSSSNLAAVATAMQVRRLTPVECERLQGFPDNYTNIPWRKSAESPDGPRYKALGNSMAVPVMRWIGERIAKVDAK